MKNKLFSLLFAIVAGTSVLCAKSGTCGPNLTWDLTNGVLTISGSGAMTNYSFSSFAPWDDYRQSITSLSLPTGLTTIGNYAFLECTSLTSVTIPNSVTSIGDGAFSYCSSLTSVTIPNSVTLIGEWAFIHCSSLTSVTIPNSVTSIDGAFAGCSGLTAINVAADNPNYSSENGVIFNKEKTILVSYPGGKQGTYIIPNSVTSIGDEAFYDCEGLTSIEIPNSVTSIGDHAFFSCSSLTSLAIGNSVTSIGDDAFSYCSSLTSVTIPNSVTSIGRGAFSSCSGLTSVTIGNSVTSIGSGAFSYCSSLTYVTIEAETPPTLDGPPFNYTNNSPIYVPCGTLYVYKTAWTDCASRIQYAPLPYKLSIQAENGNVYVVSTEDYTICDERPYYYSLKAVPNNGYHFTQWFDGNTDNPRTIDFFQDTTFTAEFAVDKTGKCGDNLALTWVYESESKTLTISGEGALNSNYTYGLEAPTQMQILVIESGVTSIGSGAFSGCSGLTSVTIPNSVTSIGDYAFHRCTGLTSITIPNSVTSIGSHAFENCSGLTTIEWNARNCSDCDFYFNAPFYDISSQITSFTIGNAVEYIPKFLCSGMDKLTNMTIPNSVTGIGYEAFSGCAQIRSITCYANWPPTCSTDCFKGINKAIPVYVPTEALDFYKAADEWKEFLNILPIDSQGIEEIVENSSQDGKFIHDNQIFILRGEKVYTLQGQEVK